MGYDEITLQNYVRRALSDDKTGHDYNHTIRVLDNCLEIARHYEGRVDLEVLRASALLHDIGFSRGFVPKHEVLGAVMTPEILREHEFPEGKIGAVTKAVLNHAGPTSPKYDGNPEGHPLVERILVDGDNLDGLGAIGLIRGISFCTSQGFPYMVTRDDRCDDSHYGSVKDLVTWPDKMLTLEGRAMGRARLPIMREFLRLLRKEMKK